MGRLKGFLARLATDEGRDDLAGLGIDERTALVIDADGHGEVMGRGEVYLIRNRTDQPTLCEPGELLKSEVDVWALTSGDTVTVPGWHTDAAVTVVVASDEQLQPDHPYLD